MWLIYSVFVCCLFCVLFFVCGLHPTLEINENTKINPQNIILILDQFFIIVQNSGNIQKRNENSIMFVPEKMCFNSYSNIFNGLSFKYF